MKASATIQSECFCRSAKTWGQPRSLLVLLHCKNWCEAFLPGVTTLRTLKRTDKHCQGFFFVFFSTLFFVDLLLALKYLSLPLLPSALIRGPIFSAAAPGWGCLVAPLTCCLTGPQIAHLCTWAIETLGQALGNLEPRSMGRI